MPNVDPVQHLYLGFLYAKINNHEGAVDEHNILKGLDKHLADDLFGLFLKK
ncbi:MAG: hypothetical protein HZA48_04715 [Planctomycetes bacterium]|nr:hypothetical protein [Planctomycetota bacterium]